MLTNRLSVCIFIIILFPASIQAQDGALVIHIRSVYETKITLLPLTGPNALKPVLIVEGVKNGEIATLKFPDENLPGEFVIRFDYKEKESSIPYPSEKRIIVSNQNIELWVHPLFCNNTDSTWFRKDERENTVYTAFMKENAMQKKMLGLLQNFLLNYDNPNSEFYKKGITEYEKRRKDSDKWIDEQIKQYKELFVSSMFGFQKVPDIVWNGNEAARKQSLRDNYFEGKDFSNPLMLKTTNMKEWMDGYVNLYGELATSIPLRDSLFTFAGKSAIEKVRTGNPLVYGWMVDYFFNGYESNNIEKGIKMLEPYLNDPDCLTAKRQAIIKRLKGIETLKPGLVAPDISMPNAENKLFELNNYHPETDYILLLFWSADCNHCNEMVGELYARFKTSEIKTKLAFVAISVDETDNEIQAWIRKKEGLTGWVHLRAQEGVRSKVANDYFILSVPVMILLNSKTKEIISLPESVEKLDLLLKI
jgi:thioredoxin-related protein